MHRKYILIGLLISFYCLDYYCRIAASLVVPELMAQLQVSTVAIGGFSSFFYLGYVLFQIPSGVLLDRYSYQRVVPISILVCVSAFILSLHTTHISVALLMRFFVGMSSAISFVSVLYIAKKYFDPRYFATISGLTIGFGTLTASLVQVVSAELMTQFYWRSVLTCISAAAIVIALLLLLPLWPVPKVVDRDVGLPKKRQCMNLLSKRFVLTAMVGGLFYLPTSLFVSLWGVPFLQTYYGMTKVSASFGVSLILWGWAFGSPLMGWVVDRVQKTQVIMFVAGICCLFVSALLIWGHSQYPIELMFLFGFFSSAQVMVWRIFHDEHQGENAGLGVALMNMIIMSFGMFFHLLVGYFVRVTGLDFQAGLTFVPYIFITALFISLMLIHQRRVLNRGVIEQLG